MSLNQCDGCRRGLVSRATESGTIMHDGPDGMPVMACSAYQYEAGTVSETVSPVCYAIFNAKGEMHWSESCISPKAEELAAELEMLTDAEMPPNSEGWHVAPLYATPSGGRSATVTPNGETPRTDAPIAGTAYEALQVMRERARQLERELAAKPRKLCQRCDAVVYPNASGGSSARGMPKCNRCGGLGYVLSTNGIGGEQRHACPCASAEEEPYFLLNGYRKHWYSFSHFDGNVVSYDDVVEWSGVNSDSNVVRERVYTVTYAMPHGSERRDGSLSKGESVAFEVGMVFNVTRTSKA